MTGPGSDCCVANWPGAASGRKRSVAVGRPQRPPVLPKLVDRRGLWNGTSGIDSDCSDWAQAVERTKRREAAARAKTEEVALTEAKRRAEEAESQRLAEEEGRRRLEA